ncbi:short-chain dehydrogenase/reductase family 42E member 1 [Sorex araneus]|uniref:short-chain dehydrogenase/reductase family 42E member 1 n=1 Tax=Sorex araneus TaxID=42254 RepID=UPI002433D5AF|nr:short-chain dehydrogenase/reductase family 42E member 1 [Sorex araneus]
MDPQDSPKEAVLITGGGGYFGFRLGCALQRTGVPVVLFDIRSPPAPLPEGMEFVRGDIRRLPELEGALRGRGVGCVFHVASYGMSGREQLHPTLIEAVNVAGTENVLRACRRRGVARLVYTSTFNVVFGGQEIRNGDESLPYLPLHLHPDHYSRTKSVAERKVLGASGPALRTCALRAAGIYGPGEQRHLPRVVSYVERGLFRFVYGAPGSLVEFVHVDNLVRAHVLAAEALTARRGHAAAGQAYFISDGRPVNSFEFFRPLVEGLGYPFPSLRLPLALVSGLAVLTEWLHRALGALCDFQPFLTRAEVYKTGVTHYFSLDKARRELGYEPQPRDLQDVVAWFRAHGHGRSPGDPGGERVRRALLVLLLLLLAGLACLLL